MKRLIPAGTILLVIIIICVFSNSSVCKTVKKAKQDITECETIYKNSNYDMAYESAIKFKKKWEKASSSVSAYANHCILDDISGLSAVLPEAVKAKNDFEVGSTISQIKVSLQRILKEQAFTFESLY